MFKIYKVELNHICIINTQEKTHIRAYTHTHTHTHTYTQITLLLSIDIFILLPHQFTIFFFLILKVILV